MRNRPRIIARRFRKPTTARLKPCNAAIPRGKLRSKCSALQAHAEVPPPIGRPSTSNLANIDRFGRTGNACHSLAIGPVYIRGIEAELQSAVARHATGKYAILWD